MDLEKALDSLKFDTRMKDWVTKQGLVTKEDIQKHMQGLADSKEQCEEVTLEDKPGFGD